MRKYIRRYLPHPDTLSEHKFFTLFGRHLLHPRIWHLNRRSAAGGLALGLFASLIPGPLQMLGAALLSVIFRVNLPLAIVGTWFSNPFTIAPLYALAFFIGRFILRSDAPFTTPPNIDMSEMTNTLQLWWQWIFALGKPLLLGLPVLALLLAALGYFGVKLSWEFWLRRHWKQRRRAATQRSTRLI